MNEEEIMKQFNDALKEETPASVTPYRATANLNTVISNPNINVNNPMDVNIQTTGFNVPPVAPPVDLLRPEMNNSVVNQNMVTPPVTQPVVPPVMPTPVSAPPAQQTPTYQPDVTEQYVSNMPIANDQVIKTTTYVSNQPQIGQKKEKKTLKITPETKVAIVIALILFIFILIMPTIYDFFRGLGR